MGGLAVEDPDDLPDVPRSRRSRSPGVPLLGRLLLRRTRSSRPSSTAHFAVGAGWLPRLLWIAALFTAGLTAFYMFRLRRR